MLMTVYLTCTICNCLLTYFISYCFTLLGHANRLIEKKGKLELTTSCKIFLFAFLLQQTGRPIFMTSLFLNTPTRVALGLLMLSSSNFRMASTYVCAMRISPSHAQLLQVIFKQAQFHFI